MPSLADDSRGFGVGDSVHVAPRGAERGADAAPERAAVVGTVAVGVDVEAAPVALLEQARHQPAGRVLAKVARQIPDAQSLAARLRRLRCGGGRQHGARPSARDGKLLCRRQRTVERDVRRPARVGPRRVERRDQPALDRVEAVPFAQVAPRKKEIGERRREPRVGGDGLFERVPRPLVVATLAVGEAEVVPDARIVRAQRDRALEMLAGLGGVSCVDADGAKRRQHFGIVASDHRALGQDAIGRGRCPCDLKRLAEHVQRAGIARMPLERAPAQCARQSGIAGIEGEPRQKSNRRERVRRELERSLARAARRVAVTAPEMQARVPEPDVLGGQLLRRGAAERGVETLARRNEQARVDVLVGKLQKRAGMIGNGGENLRVDPARLGLAPSALVREGPGEGLSQRHPHGLPIFAPPSRGERATPSSSAARGCRGRRRPVPARCRRRAAGGPGGRRRRSPPSGRPCSFRAYGPAASDRGS